LPLAEVLLFKPEGVLPFPLISGVVLLLLFKLLFVPDPVVLPVDAEPDPVLLVLAVELLRPPLVEVEPLAAAEPQGRPVWLLTPD
jgi:hypothetical protein